MAPLLLLFTTPDLQASLLGPAYQRRQERQQGARAATENVATHAENDSDPQTSDVLNVTANDGVAEEAIGNPSIEKNEEYDIAKVPEFFDCLLCDFNINWDNGLSIDITRKHGEIEQFDGYTTENDGSRHNWEMGRLGTVYPTFLDGIFIIDKIELGEDDKEKDEVFTSIID